MDINKSCEDIKNRLDNGEDLLLLDVREPSERQYCAIDGSTHIPMGEIPARMGELDPDKEIVVYCHHGMRSFQVAAFLMGRGYDKVINLAGGIDAWSLTIDPDVPRYG